MRFSAGSLLRRRARGVARKASRSEVRISCTDWIEGGWDLQQSVVFARELKKLGCDWIDCSSGGLMKNRPIPRRTRLPGPFAERIRKDAGIITIAIA